MKKESKEENKKKTSKKKTEDTKKKIKKKTKKKTKKEKEKMKKTIRNVLFWISAILIVLGALVISLFMKDVNMVALASVFLSIAIILLTVRENII